MVSYVNNELYLEDIKRVSEEYDFGLLKNKSILITGASGLICSFLVDVLMYRNINYNDNIKIYMLCRNKDKLINRFNKYELEELSENNTSNLIYIIQDICNEFKFDVNFDYIINAASNTHPKQYSSDPVGTITTNIIGLNNLLKYCINHKPKRVLELSSVEIYGSNRGDTDKFKEDYLGYIDCNTARAGYPEGKRLCEALCQSYISQFDLDIVIGRLCRIYGPTMLNDDSKALAQFIRNAVNGEDIVLKSEGTQYFSYLYMVDAVTAMLTILFNGIKGEAYNISYDKSDITLRDLASLLAKTNNKEVVFELPDEKERKGYSTANRAILDSTKLLALGWKPYYDIENGVNRTVKILKK